MTGKKLSARIWQTVAEQLLKIFTHKASIVASWHPYPHRDLCKQ